MSDRSFVFTGRHMLLIMVAFFGVVIAVNIVMTVHASRSFSGRTATPTSPLAASSQGTAMRPMPSTSSSTRSPSWPVTRPSKRLILPMKSATKREFGHS